jgi:hypothetical protein
MPTAELTKKLVLPIVCDKTDTLRHHRPDISTSLEKQTIEKIASNFITDDPMASIIKRRIAEFVSIGHVQNIGFSAAASNIKYGQGERKSKYNKVHHEPHR